MISRASTARVRGGCSLRHSRGVARHLAAVLSTDAARTVHSPYPDVSTTSSNVTEFLASSMETFGDATAMQCTMTGTKRSYADLLTETRHFAAALQRDLGFSTGSTLGLYMPNHASFPSAVLGTLSFGGIVTPANPLYSAAELTQQLKDSDAKALVCHHAVLATGAEAAANVGIPVIVLAEGEAATSPHMSFEELASSGEDGAPAFLSKAPSSDALAILPYSSGTTGLPKGVMLSHSNLIYNALQSNPPDGQYCNRGDTFLLPLPFFHIYGLGVGLNIGLSRGARIMYMPKFDLQNFLCTIQDEEVSRSHVVPPIVNALIHHPLVDSFDLSSLRCIMSAAAPLGAEQETGLAKKLPHVIVKQAWGMTELSPAGSIIDDADPRPGSGSVGCLVPSTSGRIIDPETEEVLEPSATGEIAVAGPQVMQGYLNRPEATADTFTKDNFLRTGDIGHFDANGFLYVTDRRKELIKYKGFQVPPAELESVLLTHVEITDAVVIPRACAEAGEVPRAYVVVKDGLTGIDDERAKAIMAFVAERVAPHKKLRGGVRFVESVPKSASGKLLRRVVRDMDRAEYAKKEAAWAGE